LHGNYSPAKFFDEVSLSSNLFRHSLRVSLAMLAGFASSFLLPVGHAYWIILTIAVILKPSYAITKKRNTDRLLGTIGGLITGTLIIFLPLTPAGVFMIMCIAMLASFSTWRHWYSFSVFTLTVYLLLALQLLQAGTFTLLLKDRFIDTVLASAICLLFSVLIPPVWEKQQLQPMLRSFLSSLINMFATLQANDANRYEYRQARRQLFNSYTHLSEAVQRFRHEPKLVQQHAADWENILKQCQVLKTHVLRIFNGKKNTEAEHNAAAFEVLAAMQSSWKPLMEEEATNEITNDTRWAIPIGANRRLHELVMRLQEVRAGELSEQRVETSNRHRLRVLRQLDESIQYMWQANQQLLASARRIVKP